MVATETKDWPAGVAQIVCRRADEAGQARPEPIAGECADCGGKIVMHAATLRHAQLAFPQLPIRTICVECLMRYRKPDVLHDLRGAPLSTRPCTCTGVCRGAEGLGDGWHCVLNSKREIKYAVPR